MLDHLSEEWVEALDAAARDHDALAAATRGISLVVEQLVYDEPVGDTSDQGSPIAAWHIVIDDGKVRFRPGRAEAPTIRFATDRATAASVERGEQSTQQAFMAGRLRVGGDTTVLVARHAALGGLDDVFATVRSATAPPAPRATGSS